VRQPKLFLFDEPLSNLDAALRVNTRIELAKLHRTLGATMMYVTHDQTEAMTLADKIVVLNAGRVQQVGPPAELYCRPVNKFVAGFIGSPKMNFIEGKEAAREGARSIGIRPEHIGVTTDNPRWHGLIRHAEYLGSDTFIFVETRSAGDLAVRMVGQADVKIGDEVGLAPHRDKMRRFDENDLAI
jgi:multiple sugar transport system ATP-binding protein